MNIKKNELSTLNESIAWNVNYINKIVTEKNEKTHTLNLCSFLMTHTSSGGSSFLSLGHLCEGPVGSDSCVFHHTKERGSSLSNPQAEACPYWRIREERVGGEFMAGIGPGGSLIHFLRKRI